MRTSSATLMALATLASSVSAHTWMYGVWVNGVDQGDGRRDYIRTPPNNNPVKDVTSNNIVCNVNGGKEVPNFVKAAAGDKLSFEWFHDNRNDDIIDASHKGPVITYIAKYTSGDGSGPIWTKIAEEGLSGTTWATDKLIANKGLADFSLPSSLAAGKYLIRQEIIAHHESEVSFAQNPARGAQFYPSCVQVEVTGGGSAVPDENFDFKTGYTYADPGIVGVNVYAPISSYEIPGPAVWKGQGSGSSPAPTTAAPAAPTTTAAAAPIATTPAAGSQAPSPIFSSVPAAPTTTLATVTAPAPIASSAPAPIASSAPAPTASAPAPPKQCNRRRSLKARRAKRAEQARRAQL